MLKLISALGAWLHKQFTLVNLLSAALLIFYAYHFWLNLRPRWFHPGWTTDDALQQLVPWHVVYHPHIFSGDLVTDVMKGHGV